MKDTRTKRGWLRLLVLMAAFSLIAVACGSDTADTEPAGTDAPGGTDAPAEAAEIDVFWFKVNLQEQWDAVTAEYTSENPDVVINTETVGGDQAWLPLLKSKFAAGEGPDIYMVEGAAQAAEFAGFMADLSGEPWVARAIPSALEGLNIDGKQVGMPVNLEGYGYIYNKTIFAEAGVTEVPRTLSELRAAAEKIEAAGYIPFSTGYGIWWVSGNHVMNMPFAHQADPKGFLADVLSGDATMADDALFANLKELVDITLEFGEPEPLTSNRDSQQLAFLDGSSAMFQQGNWREIEIIAANPDMEFGLAPMPLSEDPAEGDRLAVGVPFYFVVNAASSQVDQDASKAFLNWLVSSDFGKKALVEDFGFIPAYPDIEAGTLGGVSADILAYSAAGKTVPWVFGEFPDGAPLEMSESFQRYVAGVQDWDATLVEFDETWNRLK